MIWLRHIYKEMRLNMLSAKWLPFYPGVDELMKIKIVTTKLAFSERGLFDSMADSLFDSVEISILTRLQMK